MLNSLLNSWEQKLTYFLSFSKACWNTWSKTNLLLELSQSLLKLWAKTNLFSSKACGNFWVKLFETLDQKLTSFLSSKACRDSWAKTNYWSFKSCSNSWAENWLVDLLCLKTYVRKVVCAYLVLWVCNFGVLCCVY